MESASFQQALAWYDAIRSKQCHPGALCPPGAALLRIVRRGYLADGGMVALTCLTCRGDSCGFVNELREM